MQTRKCIPPPPTHTRTHLHIRTHARTQMRPKHAKKDVGTHVNTRVRQVKECVQMRSSAVDTPWLNRRRLVCVIVFVCERERWSERER